MNDPIKLILDGKPGDRPLEADETGKLNMVYKSPHGPAKVKAEGFFDITPEMSLLHASHTAENCYKLHERTPDEAMRIIDPKEIGSPWSKILVVWQDRKAAYEINHLIGRIDLTLRVLDMGVRKIQWSQPEAGLHPAWCCEMGDLLIRLAGAGKGADNE